MAIFIFLHPIFRFLTIRSENNRSGINPLISAGLRVTWSGVVSGGVLKNDKAFASLDEETSGKILKPDFFGKKKKKRFIDDSRVEYFQTFITLKQRE